MKTRIDSFTGTYAFLSNFFPSEIVYAGHQYDTVEHGFQAAKTLDKWEQEAIRLAPSPGHAKRMGNRGPKGVIRQLRPDWENVKQDIMLMLLRLKFQDPELRRLLLSTGDRELIEGNNRGDTIWGVCNGTGSNFLGKLLMRVRKEISDEAKKAE